MFSGRYIEDNGGLTSFFYAFQYKYDDPWARSLEEYVLTYILLCSQTFPLLLMHRFSLLGGQRNAESSCLFRYNASRNTYHKALNWPQLSVPWRHVTLCLFFWQGAALAALRSGTVPISSGYMQTGSSVQFPPRRSMASEWNLLLFPFFIKSSSP